MPEKPGNIRNIQHPYAYKEYPKSLNRKDEKGNDISVNSAEEEAAVLASVAEPEPEVVAELPTDEAESEPETENETETEVLREVDQTEEAVEDSPRRRQRR